LRGEFLNTFNYAQYNYDTTNFNDFPLCVTCGDFGDLNATQNSPRTIQLSLKLMF
jgi:hypothetical protein